MMICHCRQNNTSCAITASKKDVEETEKQNLGHGIAWYLALMNSVALVSPAPAR
jgi:hypothetical protein